MEKNEKNEKIAEVFLILLIIVGCVISSWLGYNLGHTRGQIEAINGNIQYELRTNADRSVDWRHIEDK